MNKDLKPILYVVNDLHEAKNLVFDEAFCPIECSIGGDSVVDPLTMDHHGQYSGLEGVAIRAYRDHFGARRDEPYLVTTSPADADACFATAALLGILPHPSRAAEPGLAHMPPAVREMYCRDLTSLAAAINLFDTDPIGTTKYTTEEGQMLLLWQAICGGLTSHMAYAAGVQMWAQLTLGNPSAIGPLLHATMLTEDKRQEAAQHDLEECRRYAAGPVLALIGTQVWGFDVWYGRDVSAGPPSSPEGWENPVVMAMADRSSEVTIGCPNAQVAEALFGPGGLKNVFAQLEPAGWGGREAIGGSPRGLPMLVDQVIAAANKVASLQVTPALRV